MKMIPWSTVLGAARAAAAKLPAPADVDAIARNIARDYVARGYAVEGFASGDLQPGDIPTGDAGLSARARAIARSRGVDRRGIDDRRHAPAETLETVTPAPRPKRKPAAKVAEEKTARPKRVPAAKVAEKEPARPKRAPAAKVATKEPARPKSERTTGKETAAAPATRSSRRRR